MSKDLLRRVYEDNVAALEAAAGEAAKAIVMNTAYECDAARRRLLAAADQIERAAQDARRESLLGRHDVSAGSACHAASELAREAAAYRASVEALRGLVVVVYGAEAWKALRDKVAAAFKAVGEAAP